MSTTDGRQYSEEALQLLRRQAHRLRHELNLTWLSIAEIVGVNRATLMSWVRRFHLNRPELGEVSSQVRGRRYGAKRTLSESDEQALRETVLHETPQALGLGFALWSRAAVQQAIEVKFGVKMPISTVGEYLRRWGCTPQRPAQRAQDQDAQALQQWQAVDYPALQQRAKTENAEICWADETAVRQDTAWVRGYAPTGHTPELVHRVRWSHITMISALSNQGLVRFALHDGSINAARFIDFLQALVQDVAAPRKVFLIVDNLRVHHAKVVQDWLAEPAHHARIELFYLPPYCPEHNPDEWINRDLKTYLRQAAPIQDDAMLRTLAEQFMTRLRNARDFVKTYFHHTHTRYASAESGV
ncbi:MAG: hypothetical protein RLZZ584_4633 [Pseudomonadota bacterium]|jgi:transposase